MRHSNPYKLNLETYSFKKDVERIKENYDTLHALERKLNYYLDTPNVDRSTKRTTHRSRSNSSSPSRRDNKRVNWTDLQSSGNLFEGCACGKRLCDCCSVLYRSTVGAGRLTTFNDERTSIEGKARVLQDKIEAFKKQNDFFTEQKPPQPRRKSILKSSSVRSRSPSSEKENPRSRTPSAQRNNEREQKRTEKCNVAGCCYNDSGSSLRLNTASSRNSHHLTPNKAPAPRFDAIYDNYNKRPEYNYLGLEKPLASEIVSMAKRFDKEKQDLLDLVQLQQRVISNMTHPSCCCTTIVTCAYCRKSKLTPSKHATHSFVEKRVPLEACRPSSPGPLGYYTMEARDRIDDLIRRR